MPNHIFTQATITGPAEVLATIATIAGADEDQSVLEHYLPLPDEATETRTYTTADGRTEEYGVFTGNGYTTALNLWGSKWADYEVELDHYDATVPVVCLRFQSAWSPVVEGYRKLSSTLGIDAVLAYEDECGNYLGASAVADGQVVFEAYVDGDAPYDTLPEEPEDTESDEWYAWNDARSAAWFDACDKAEQDAHAALDAYRKGAA